MSDKKIVIYTDGAARGNPGKGGYGVVMIWKNVQKEMSKGYRLTTNNRMELLAVIRALEAIKKPGFELDIYTDSKYVADSITKGWLYNWIKTDFKGGKKNKDLWARYFNLSKQFKINFHWVKGHAENFYNNRCDELATQAADGTDLETDEGYENLIGKLY